MPHGAVVWSIVSGPQHSCCCNSLLVDTELGAGSRTAAEDCSNKEAFDRLRYLDTKGTLAGPWMLFPLFCVSMHALSDWSDLSGEDTVAFFILGTSEVNCPAYTGPGRQGRAGSKRKVGEIWGWRRRSLVDIALTQYERWRWFVLP